MIADKGNAAFVVNEISNSLLGKIGGALAFLGLVAAPITSGDTAFRSVRLIVAGFLNFKQGSIKNHLMISIPLFAVVYNLSCKNVSYKPQIPHQMVRVLYQLGHYPRN